MSECGSRIDRVCIAFSAPTRLFAPEHSHDMVLQLRLGCQKMKHFPPFEEVTIARCDLNTTVFQRAFCRREDL